MSESEPASGRSKPQVRARVLRAALSAFAELGPDRVRVQDIADRAGMSSGHVMYYFGDRDRILMGTLLLSEESLAERRDRTLARAADPAEALDRAIRLYLPTGPRDVRWLLWAQAMARPPADPATRERLRAAVDAWATAIAGELAALPGVPASVDCSVAAYRLCRLMDGLAMEILLGAPGRGRAWAVAEAAAALRTLARL